MFTCKILVIDYKEYVYCLCIFSCAVRSRGEAWATMITTGGDTTGFDYFYSLAV
jgi:hypothetical protein